MRPKKRHNLDEVRFWNMTCGCPKPVIHYSSDFGARVCQNCGVILTASTDADDRHDQNILGHHDREPLKAARIVSHDTVTADAFGETLDHSHSPGSQKEALDDYSNINSFVHLRVHTHLSLLKATCKHTDLIKLAKKYGMPALAKTEFGNMCGAPTFVRDCQKAGIKPILGTEFEVRFDDVPYPVTFIAMNREGYKQLVRMNTVAWCERKDKKKDAHLLSDDIPSSNSIIALVDVGPSPDMAKLVCQHLFGRLPTFLEVNTEEDPVFNAARQIQSETGLPIVVTGNVYYTHEEDKHAYGVGLKIGKHAIDYMVADYVDNWFKSPDRYGTLYSYPAEWVEMSNTIAARVEDYGIVNVEPIIPTYKEPGKEYTDLAEVDRKLEVECWQGLYEKGKADNPIYQERLQFELQIMKEKKFSSYHLLIGEIVSWMVSVGIMAPFGRGSSVGSLVCYALDIIAIDPIEWGVPFERYINSGRVDLPDIDTDISQERRGEVLRHIADLHGSDRVAHIATFQTMKLRAAIENTGRALQVQTIVLRDIKKVTPEDAVEWEDINQDNKDAILKIMDFKPEWIEVALALTGSAKNLGYHAAGVVIANDSLNDLVPILPPEEEGGLIGVQYDMHDCEILGLLKLDMLGLRNIDIIQHTVDRIEARHGNRINVYNLPSDNAATYDTISGGNYVSVFQLDSGGYRRLCRQLRPDNFHHLMALNALFRPGPLEGGMTNEYVERRHGRRELVGWHPLLDKVLESTFQVPVFQEQIMAMSKLIAGFDDVRADKYRKAIGKKDQVKFNAAQNEFRKGALSQPGLIAPPGWGGTLEEWIDDLLTKLAGYARYGWNIGHSAGYGRITYVTAYMETHYPHEYYASLLDAYAANKQKLPVLLRAILSTKTKIVPPSVNESKHFYDVGSDGRIYMGLGAVRNVGKAADSIIEERETNGPFMSFIQFCQRMPKVNKTAKVNLVKAGAFSWDKMLCDRDKIDNISVIQKWTKKKNKKFDGSKVPSFEIAMKLEMIQGYEYSEIERANAEREALNTFITGHPANVYQSLASFLERGKIKVITPSQINPDEVTVGETVLLVGMVDYIRRKMTQGNERFASRPYLNLSVSDTETFQVTNIWHPLCDDLEKVLVAGQMAMFECQIKKDRFSEEKFMVRVDTAISLAYGLPIQGVFRVNGHDPGEVVARIGGTVKQVTQIGARNYASIRGRIAVQPHILNSMINELGDDISYLISMDALGAK